MPRPLERPPNWPVRKPKQEKNRRSGKNSSSPAEKAGEGNDEMGKTSRYETSLLIENQHEPGSHGRVLKNLLGIKTKREMEKVESRELLHTMEWMAEKYGAKHRFSADDICSMHGVWLGNIYEWAGRYRNVTMSKGGFLFAAPAFIPRLMADFEREILHRYTPCRADSRNELVEALAVVHTEFLLIHPFREGNGRIARQLAVFMVLQAGMPSLDLAIIRGKRKEAYFGAVRAGLERDYEPMKRVFNEAILRTLRVDMAGQRQTPPGKPIQDQPWSRESPRSPKRK
jgi:cell filamentation protein